jgi:hypothetical protein
VLSSKIREALTAEGLTVLSASRVPSNDGGLALGQGWVAAEIWRRRSASSGRGPPAPSGLSGDPTAHDDPNEDRNDRHHEQHVDETTQRDLEREAEHPHQHKNDSDAPQ